MRNYGGLRKKVPLTFWAMMIGTLAITGVGIPLTHIGFAGFLSKYAVIESAFVGSQYAFWMLVIAAFMTSFYSWRLMFMTFFGTPRGDHHAHDHAHESPKVMLIPLGILALGAVFSGMLWYKVFFGDEAKLRSWFGMPAGIEHAEAGHGSAGEAAAGDHAATATTEDHAATATPMVEAAAEDHAATAAADAVPAAGQAVPAPVQGALFFGPDNQMIHKAHGVPDNMPVTVTRLPGTPTTINDAALARRLNAVMQRELGAAAFQPFEQRNMGAEDFTYFVAADTGVPGYYFAVGGTTPERIAAAKAGGAPIAGHHSPLFQVAPRESVVLGTRAMVAAVLDLAPAK
jgi:hypothetical protein